MIKIYFLYLSLLIIVISCSKDYDQYFKDRRSSFVGEWNVKDERSTFVNEELISHGIANLSIVINNDGTLFRTMPVLFELKTDTLIWAYQYSPEQITLIRHFHGISTTTTIYDICEFGDQSMVWKNEYSITDPNDGDVSKIMSEYILTKS